MSRIPAGLAQAAAPAAATPEWVVLRCGDSRFGVPIRAVREIIAPRPLTRLPGCGPEVRGLIGVRGRVITVLDLAAALGLEAQTAAPEERVVLVEHGGRLAGFAVHAVLGVAPGAPDALPLPAQALRGLDIDRADVFGVGELHDRPFLAVDPRRLMDRLLVAHPSHG